LPASPCAAEFHEIWHTRSTHRRNHVGQMFSQSVQGLRSSDTPNCPLPQTCCVALTTVYALSCYTVIGKWSVLLHVNGHLAEFLLVYQTHLHNMLFCVLKANTRDTQHCSVPGLILKTVKYQHVSVLPAQINCNMCFQFPICPDEFRHFSATLKTTTKLQTKCTQYLCFICSYCH